jgi:ATP-dependent helicase/nuclease subunit B
MSAKAGGKAKVYSLAPELAFADTLAAGLLQRAGDDPEALGDLLVLLPNRRAGRSLREAFLRRSEGKPLLLPRILALGDQDEEELLLSDPTGLPAEAEGELPEAIDDHQRLFRLSRLVAEWRSKVEGGEAQQSPAQDLRLAKELAQLLDQVETEGLSFDGLATLAPEDFSEHWGKTVRFLEIVSHYWPEEERALRAASAAKRRRLLLEWQAAAWEREPPGFPVIAAGSTGSIPASARLLRVVASLPRGEVLLPGFERGMSAEVWEAVLEDPSHPQHGMALLLRAMELEPKAVEPWSAPLEPSSSVTRQQALAEALRPAPLTDRWGEKRRHFPQDALETAFKDVTWVDCPSPREEALVIALALREVLETSGKTAALVTTDRLLAQRVAAELRRWKIEIDDSAGEPLAETAVGGYLRLTARLLSEGPTALNLLAALKHPKARGGEEGGEFRRQLRDFERFVLRGPAPLATLPALSRLLEEAIKEPRNKGRGLEKLRPWLAEVTELLEPPLKSFGSTGQFRDLLEAHLRFAEALAGTEGTPGPLLLWRDEDGDKASDLLRKVHSAAPILGEIDPKEYSEVLDLLMETQPVRKPYGQHPRLFIWGAMEARLQRADRMILGGLNEGSWPRESDPGPWMSRPMRKAFGLPSPERAIGLAAHDFAQGMGAAEVFLTRADRVEGAPSVPSRWLLRLKTFLKAVGAREDLLTRDAARWLAWAEELDRAGEQAPAPAPEPRPPLEARPTSASVTDIERWQRDPYAFYAKKVLALSKLEELDAPPSAAERGTAIHAALEAFGEEFPEAVTPEAEARLFAIFEELKAQLDLRPAQGALWGPRLDRIARWVIEQEKLRRQGLARVYAERSGRMEVPGAEGFELYGKADRIEELSAGGFAVLDYKTGKPPSNKDVEQGRAPQLVLEAALLKAGAFEDVPAGEARELTYWRLSGGREAGQEQTFPVTPEFVEESLAKLARLVRRYRDPAMPYRARPRPELSLRFNDYAHLARIKEWAGDEEEEWSP